MIIFSCKNITEEELVRCSFSLNKTEYNVLIFLLRKDSLFSIPQISKMMKLERSTIQKAIKNLLSERLVKRTQNNLSKGGYIFLYKPNNKNEIKNRMREITSRWYKKIEESIDKL